MLAPEMHCRTSPIYVVLFVSPVAVATAGTVEETRSPTEDDDPFEHIEYSEYQA